MIFRFDPTTPDPASASVANVDFGDGIPWTFRLGGNSDTPAGAAFTLSPTALDFGGVLLGQSATRTTTVTNASAVAQTVTLNLPAVAAPFSLAQDGCHGRVLAAQETCQLTFRFEPASVGPASTSLVGIDLGDGTPWTLALSGSGDAPASAAFTLSPLTLDFGSVWPGQTATRTATVTNASAAAQLVTLTQQGLTAPYSASTDCNAPLAPGASCLITYQFRPTVAGAAAASVSVNLGDGTPRTLQLRGLGATAADAIPVPTLSTWTLALLGLATAALTGGHWRRRAPRH